MPPYGQAPAATLGVAVIDEATMVTAPNANLASFACLAKLESFASLVQRWNAFMGSACKGDSSHYGLRTGWIVKSDPHCRHSLRS